MPLSDQGVTLDRYMLIPRTLVFLTRGDDVLLIKGASTKRLWANLYNGIGGHVEPGEDVLSAAKREVKEETSLTPEELWLCGTIVVHTGQNPGIGIFVFRGECLHGDPQDSTEGTLAWIPVHQLDHHPLVEDLRTILPRVFSTNRGDPPFSALYTYGEGDRLQITFGI